MATLYLAGPEAESVSKLKLGDRVRLDGEAIIESLGRVEGGFSLSPTATLRVRLLALGQISDDPT